MYEDKTLVCKECGNEFVFTAGEQEFYAEKGFTNEPQRCKACRQARKNAAKTEREFFETVCAECGGIAKLDYLQTNFKFKKLNTKTVGICSPFFMFFIISLR